MAKRRLKDVKQIVIRPNKSPQTLITYLGKENHNFFFFFHNRRRLKD
jgi:hypothetical protein